MKSIITVLTLLLSTFIYAHDIQSTGCIQGRLKYHCSDFQDGGHQYVKVHISSGTWGNGSQDTIFKISPSYEFDINVPYPISPDVFQTITFTNTNHNGNANGECHVAKGYPCQTMPLKYKSIKVTKQSDNTAKVSVTVFHVLNVSTMSIYISIDNQTYYLKGIIFPTDGTEEKTYDIIIKLNP